MDQWDPHTIGAGSVGPSAQCRTNRGDVKWSGFVARMRGIISRPMWEIGSVQPRAILPCNATENQAVEAARKDGVVVEWEEPRAGYSDLVCRAGNGQFQTQNRN